MDITYCSKKECSNLQCDRHQVNIPKKPIDIAVSIANMDTGCYVSPLSDLEGNELFNGLFNGEQSYVGHIYTPNISTPCMICGENVPVTLYDAPPKICDSCKDAIKFVREHLKEKNNASDNK